jgi:hypothetical protein
MSQKKKWILAACNPSKYAGDTKKKWSALTLHIFIYKKGLH